MREVELPRTVQNEIDAGRLTLHWGDGVPLKAYFEGADEAFVDLCKLGTLIELNLDSSAVTSAAFAAVAWSTRLEALSLQFTSVSGDAFRALRSCTNLQTLVCNPAQEVTEAATAIGSLVSLRDLNIEAGSWCDLDVRLICEKLRLRSLSLAQCSQLSDESAAALLPLVPSLESFSASDTSFGDDACRFIGKLDHSIKLGLGGTAVTAVGVAQLRSLVQLRSLRLIGCTNLNDADSFIDTIAALTNLESLFIDGCAMPRSAVLKLSRLRKWKLLSA